MKTLLCILVSVTIGTGSVLARVNPASPVFAVRNDTHVASLDREGLTYVGLKTLDGGVEYQGFARAMAAEDAQLSPAQTPASLGVSLCLGSACAGSVCFGSACALSFCFGSLCGNSRCGGSACAVSLCGGSACGASVCGGSACLGSVCAGSACLGSGCGGESFPVVRACDYTIERKGIVLMLGVDKPTRLAAGNEQFELAKDRINHVRIDGAYVGAEFQTTESGMAIVLRTITGETQQLRIGG